MFVSRRLSVAPCRNEGGRVRMSWVAVLCWGILASLGCSSAVKCENDAGCPAGAFCSSEYGVCFERLTFTHSLVAGDSHSCAGTTAAGAKCWGANPEGRLGDGTLSDRPTPTAVRDLSEVKVVAAGVYHSCAIVDGGTVRCWGWNQSGQVTGVAGPDISSPTTVASLSGIAALGLGQSHSCALTTDGKIKCWGDNTQGQLGGFSGAPALLASDAGVTAIGSGATHVCAVSQDKRLFCWGSNTDGQASWRMTGKTLPSPTDVGLSKVEAVAAGQSHTCALTSANVLCWGANDKGQLGRAGGGDPTAAGTTPSLTGVQSIAAGCDHTCALRTDGTVFCWGSNENGELGNGTIADGGTATPGRVSSLTGVEAIAVGCRHTCASVKGGAVLCWGDGTRGQLGDNTQKSHSAPVVVKF